MKYLNSYKNGEFKLSKLSKVILISALLLFLISLSALSSPTLTPIKFTERQCILTGNESYLWTCDVGLDYVNITPVSPTLDDITVCTWYDENGTCITNQTLAYPTFFTMYIGQGSSKELNISIPLNVGTLIAGRISQQLDPTEPYYQLFDNPIIIYPITTYNSTDINITQENNFAHLTLNDSDIILYYPFDVQEDVNNITYDYSANNNDGTVANATWTSLGKYGTAYNFSGVLTEYITYNCDGCFVGMYPTTVSFWFKPNSLSGTQVIISYPPSDASIAFSGGNYLHVGTTSYRYGADLSLFSVGEWTHVAVVYNSASSMEVYVNGTNATVTTDDYWSDGEYILGKRVFATEHPFNGSLDEIMIFNRSLTAGEISDLYNSTYQRFYQTGEMLFENNNFSTNNTVNISIPDCQQLNGSQLSFKINDGSYQNLNSTCAYDGYSIAGNLTSANLTLKFNSTPFNFYSPVLFGNITLDDYSVIISDIIPPTYSNNETNNTATGLSTNFSLTVNDDTALQNLGYYIFSTNNTGVWTNDSAVNFTETPYRINVTKTLNSTSGISIGYRWYLYDNSTNENITEIFTLTTITPDTTNPIFTYIPPNATLIYATDTLGVNFSATDETSFDSYSVNDSSFSINSTGWLSNATILPVGNYTLNISINDSSGNENSTEYLVTVNQANPNGSISGTTPLSYGTAGDVTGTGCSSQITCNLYRNGTLVSNPDTTILAVGTYNYVYNTTGGTNYSANSSLDTFLLTVNQNTASCNVLFNETSPITYPETFLVWSDCNSDFTLYRNGTIISNNSEQILSAGSWNFTVIRNDSVNYSILNDTQIFTVNQSPAIISLSGTSPITYETAGDVEGIGCPSQLTCNLYRNGTLVSNPDTTILGAETYHYIYNTTGNENYTSNSTTFDLTVNPKTSNVTLFINGSRANFTSEYDSPVYFVGNLTTGDFGTLNLTINDSEVNSSSSQNLTYTFIPSGIGDYVINLSYTSTSNYSDTYESWNITILDTTPPTMSILYPVNGNNYSTTSFDLNYSSSDLLGSRCWYSIDGGSTNSSDVSFGTNFTSVSGSEGLNNWTVYCNDTSGNIASDSINFTIDTTPPVFTSITNQSALTSNNFSYTPTASDSGVNDIKWTINNTNNFTINSDTGEITNVTALDEGYFVYNISVNDSLGNINWTIWAVNISLPDITSPTISIVYPENTTYTINVSELNFSASDNFALDSCWYSTDGGSTNSTPNDCTSNFTAVVSNEGSNTWTVYANDTSGNVNSSTVTFFKDSLAPSINSYSITSSLSSGENATIRINITDSDLDAVWVQVKDTANQSTNYTLNQEGSTDFYNNSFIVTTAGTWYYQIYANDSYGNLNDSIAEQSFTVSAPNATPQSEDYPTYALPSSTIIISASLYAVDFLREVNATLNVPSGFIFFLSDYNQTQSLGNFSASQTKTARWFVSLPSNETTHTFNITWTDYYNNSFQGDEKQITVTYDSTNLTNTTNIDVITFTELEAGDVLDSEIQVRDINGDFVNATSVQITLYDSSENTIVDSANFVSQLGTGRYFYNYTTPSSPTGQWQIYVNVTRNGNSFFDREYFRLTGGPFDIRNITVTDSVGPDLGISTVLENMGDSVTDIVVDWNLTRTDTGDLLDSGQDTIGVTGAQTHTITPSTTYIGEVKITFLGTWSSTEKAGAYEVFTISTLSTTSSGGGGGGSSGGAIITGDATEVICDFPYIRHDVGCCLDVNDNLICDNDELTATNDSEGTEGELGETPGKGISFESETLGIILFLSIVIIIVLVIIFIIVSIVVKITRRPKTSPIVYNPVSNY